MYSIKKQRSAVKAMLLCFGINYIDDHAKKVKIKKSL